MSILGKIANYLYSIGHTQTSKLPAPMYKYLGYRYRQAPGRFLNQRQKRKIKRQLNCFKFRSE
jgi:hypothetical protein